MSKINRILRREGAAGLWSRIRYPKKDGGSAARTPPQDFPFRIIGCDPDLVEVVADRLRHIAGEAAVSDTSAATPLYVNPLADEKNMPAKAAILFTEDMAAINFMNDKGARSVNTYSAILLPSAACIRFFHHAGIDKGRVFAISPFSALVYPELAGNLFRWLLTTGAVTPDKIDTSLFPIFAGLEPYSRLCLSLPESLERREGFLRQDFHDFHLFNGFRLRPGWQGAGWSHTTIAQAALTRNAVPLWVCEDDMRLDGPALDHLDRVEAYLATKDWDIFSGLLTDVNDDFIIHKVEKLDGLTFIHLNYTTGMVLNFYNLRSLKRLAAWTPGEGRPETDTVDAWLSTMPEMRVVTTLPFLARHEDRATSTVFGFANQRYNSVIRASEQRLAQRVIEWSSMELDPRACRS